MLRCVVMHRRTARRLLTAATTAVAGACLAAAMALLPSNGVVGAATPATGTVSGIVWHDLDSDGIRDAGEPGLPHVTIVWMGRSARAVTGKDGRWTLTLPAGRATLTAITGWLPSACPGDLHCAAGRTAHQRFAVRNQYVEATVDVTAGVAGAGLDLGLEPDRGDPTGSPTSLHSGNDRGDGVPRSHDLAARNSIIGRYGCPDEARTRRCPIGTKLGQLGQIYNQGTAWVTGIRFVLTIPPGTVLTAEPTVDATTPGPSPTRTGRTGTTRDGSTWIEYHLGRNLPPASAVWMRSSIQLVAGPSSPLSANVTSTVDRKAFLSVSQVTPGDNDSPLRVDPRIGLDGGHNLNHPRRLDDDTSDAIEFNVA
jgi:hypothetical protein